MIDYVSGAAIIFFVVLGMVHVDLQRPGVLGASFRRLTWFGGSERRRP